MELKASPWGERGRGLRSRCVSGPARICDSLFQNKQQGLNPTSANPSIKVAAGLSGNWISAWIKWSPEPFKSLPDPAPGLSLSLFIFLLKETLSQDLNSCSLPVLLLLPLFLTTNLL